MKNELRLNWDHKLEEQDSDGYTIESNNKYGNPESGKLYAIWPPEGNSIGSYDSLETAQFHLKSWKEVGHKTNSHKLAQDGGADYRVKRNS